MTLTKSEEKLMNVFWEYNKPLTSIDITHMQIKSTWSSGLIQNMIRSLIKKGMLKQCGMRQYVTQYAREFLPAITKEEYVAQLVLTSGIQTSSIPKVMAALTEEMDINEEIINQLEEIIKKLKEE